METQFVHGEFCMSYGSRNFEPQQKVPKASSSILAYNKEVPESKFYQFKLGTEIRNILSKQNSIHININHIPQNQIYFRLLQPVCIIRVYKAAVNKCQWRSTYVPDLVS